MCGRTILLMGLALGACDAADAGGELDADRAPTNQGGDASLDAAQPGDASATPDAARSVDAGAAPDAAREGDAAPRDAGPTSLPDAALDAGGCEVGPVPAALRSRLELDAFYRKYADADGLPVLGSDAPEDRALRSACALVKSMARGDVRAALIEARARFVIIGRREGTADVPEYGYRERTQAERDQINQRARGLGGQVASCGEENILCLAGDRYRDESICVHEFAHTISTYGVYRADRTFESRLEQSYQRARASDILDGTYRGESTQEYWAEGVQDWYDTNASANPSNGIHNQVDTRAELKTFDPTLYGLIEEVFPAQLAREDCHAN